MMQRRRVSRPAAHTPCYYSEFYTIKVRLHKIYKRTFYAIFRVYTKCEIEPLFILICKYLCRDIPYLFLVFFAVRYPYFFHILCYFCQLIILMLLKDIGISIHCNTDISMSHKLLKYNRFHARLYACGSIPAMTVGTTSVMRIVLQKALMVNIIAQIVSTTIMVAALMITIP